MTDTVRVPKALSDWLYGVEGYGLRVERLSEELRDPVDKLLPWLLAAFEVGLAASPQGEGSSAEADTHRAAEGAVVGYSGPFGLGWLTEALGNRGVEVSPGYSPAMAAIIALDHYRGALEGNPLADPSSLSATPPAETEWITHDGGPNPVPGKMVDAELGCGVFVNCLSDLLTMFWPKGGRYRVTEGVKP